MKKKLSIFLCVLFFSLSSFESNKNIIGKSSKMFVGYQKENPVFDSSDEKTLYVLKNEKLELLTKYSVNYSVRIVKDNYICYSEKTKAGTNIVVSISGKERKIPIISKFTYVTINNDGTIYYTDLKQSNSIKEISSNSQPKLTGISGYIITCLEGYLYYSKEHDENIESANADIFKYDLKTKKTKRILINVAGEGTIIFPDQNYIFDEILTGGEYKPILYSVKDKKYTLLPKKYAGAPYYSYQKKCLIYYDDDGKEIEKLEIPRKFTISR